MAELDGLEDEAGVDVVSFDVDFTEVDGPPGDHPADVDLQFAQGVVHRLDQLGERGPGGHLAVLGQRGDAAAPAGHGQLDPVAVLAGDGAAGDDPALGEEIFDLFDGGECGIEPGDRSAYRTPDGHGNS